uniref:Rhodanese domain-containing protein n=1 Tax=Mastacembelus armatus TaxID=205130 RepID=A0A3Q3RFU4_9TELE
LAVNKEISCEELKALVENSQTLLLVDVRTKEEVDKGCIPRSIHIPFDTVEDALTMNPDEFQTKYGATKPTLHAPELVFYCQLGRRGEMATSKAHKLGYVNPQNLTGGYKGWSEKNGK